LVTLFAAACCGCNPAAASTVFFSLWIAAAAIQTDATVSACSQPNTPRVANYELVQAPADLLGRRKARARRGRHSGVGVGRGRRQGAGAGAGREEAASCGEHEAPGRRGWDQPPDAGQADSDVFPDQPPRAPPQFTSRAGGFLRLRPLCVCVEKKGPAPGPGAFVGLMNVEHASQNNLASRARAALLSD
jgi:hypothetical protein